MLNAKQILGEITHIFDNVTIDKVKNSLKRKLINKHYLLNFQLML